MLACINDFVRLPAITGARRGGSQGQKTRVAFCQSFRIALHLSCVLYSVCLVSCLSVISVMRVRDWIIVVGLCMLQKARSALHACAGHEHPRGRVTATRERAPASRRLSRVNQAPRAAHLALNFILRRLRAVQFAVLFFTHAGARARLLCRPGGARRASAMWRERRAAAQWRIGHSARQWWRIAGVDSAGSPLEKRPSPALFLDHWHGVGGLHGG